MDLRQFIYDLPYQLTRTGRRRVAEDLPEIEFNGRKLTWATTLSGEPVLVPHPDMPGVATLAYASASWLPGGPVEFEQFEGIYALNGRYWVQASGDDHTSCVYLGEFESEVDGVAAALAASHYFKMSESGQIASELNDRQDDV